LYVPPIPGSLKVEDCAPQVKSHPQEAEEAFSHHAAGNRLRSRVGVTHNHRVEGTHNHEAGIILVYEAEQDTLDFEVDHLTQCQRLEPGKMRLMTQTTVKW